MTLKASGGNKEERELLIAQIADLSFASGKAKLPKGSEFQLLYFRTLLIWLGFFLFVYFKSEYIWNTGLDLTLYRLV